MPKKLKLNELYTVSVSFPLVELPDYFKNVGSDHLNKFDTMYCYVSIQSRLNRHCVFLESEHVASLLIGLVKPDLSKSIPNVQFNIDRVADINLKFRKKNAIEEALRNTVLIKSNLLFKKYKNETPITPNGGCLTEPHPVQHKMVEIPRCKSCLRLFATQQLKAICDACLDRLPPDDDFVIQHLYG